MEQSNSDSFCLDTGFSNFDVNAAVLYSGRCNEILGPAFLVREAYESGDLATLWTKLYKQSLDKPAQSAALLDMSTVLLVSGQRELGLIAQKNALKIGKDYLKVFGAGNGLRVLAIMAPGDLMSNTPIDFLLRDSNFRLIQHFVDENTTSLSDLPEHDIVFVAIAESGENALILKRINNMLKSIDAPIVNNAPVAIAKLTRDGVASMFKNSGSIFSPDTDVVTRDNLVKIAQCQSDSAIGGFGISCPFIVRPVGTHAGFGMKKIDTLSELSEFLELIEGDQFYVCPFVDYCNADGMFRKYRIAFIDRKPFPCHLAISKNWMIHYLNAEMDLHAERRAEEADWFSDFEMMAELHAETFAELCATVNLDYFVIDCAFLENGKLLLFEVDVGMIVHDMDSIEMFPYKKPAMTTLFAAFQAMLLEKLSKSIGGDPTFLKSRTHRSTRTELELVHD